MPQRLIERQEDFQLGRMLSPLLSLGEREEA